MDPCERHWALASLHILASRLRSSAVFISAACVAPFAALKGKNAASSLSSDHHSIKSERALTARDVSDIDSPWRSRPGRPRLFAANVLQREEHHPDTTKNAPLFGDHRALIGGLSHFVIVAH